MANSNEPISLEKKFKLAEYDFNEENNAALAPKKEIEGRQAKGESFFKIIFSFFIHVGSLVKSFFLLVTLQMKKLLTFSIVTSKRVSSSMDRAREKQEVKTDVYLKNSLAAIDEVELKESMITNKNEEQKIEFASMFNNTLSHCHCISNLEYDSEFNEEVRPTVEYTAEALTYLSKKMTEARLMANVTSAEVTFRPDLSNKRVETTVTYQLNTNGSVWANVYASFIIKKMVEGLKPWNGTMSAIYQCNATLKIETFSVLIVHDLLVQGAAFLTADDKVILNKAEFLDM
jgi:hypothetical protein